MKRFDFSMQLIDQNYQNEYKNQKCILLCLN